MPATNRDQEAMKLRKFSDSLFRRTLSNGQLVATDGNLVSTRMKKGLQLRLTLFALAMMAVMSAIAWTVQTTWQVARRDNDSILKAQVASFEIADHLQATILDLDSSLRRYALRQKPADWEKFSRQSEELDHWIDEKYETLRDDTKRELVSKIDAAFEAYRAKARELTNTTASGGDPVTALAEIEGIESASKDLLEMGNHLADAHREQMDTLIGNAQKSSRHLQRVIFALLMMLLGLGAWVAIVIYREMIAPLRVKLIESQTIIERQEKLASLGVLAAGLAHEIRNPLTAIKARLFTQQKVLRAESREFQDSVVIGNEINRLEHIVKDVLLFARPAEPKLAAVPLRTLFSNLRDLLGPQLERSDIRFQIDEGTHVNLRADAAQLQQVLINLVQNAADSIGRNGTIILRSRQGLARLQGVSQPVVFLEVEDTGKGILPEIQKRLFDPFFTTKEEGTGLGLAISARIVQKHGGALEFQTQPDHGTKFGIVLPSPPWNE